MDIKRDFTAWDFVKQKQKPKPKQQTSIIGDGGGIFTVAGGYNTQYSTIVRGHNNVILGRHDTTITTTDVNDTVFVTNLGVGGSANIPPTQGQMKYDVESGETMVYIQDGWITHELHQEPKIPLLTRFKNWLKNDVF